MARLPPLTSATLRHSLLAGRTLRVVYIFPGQERYSAVQKELQTLCDEWEGFLNMTEVDVLCGPDVIDNSAWQPLFDQAVRGGFDYSGDPAV